METPVCGCHGEPCYWNKNPRLVAGGHWRCAVKKREQQRVTDVARRDIKILRQRERYDRDPLYRISKRLRQDARDRRATIERQRASLLLED